MIMGAVSISNSWGIMYYWSTLLIHILLVFLAVTTESLDTTENNSGLISFKQ